MFVKLKYNRAKYAMARSQNPDIFRPFQFPIESPPSNSSRKRKRKSQPKVKKESNQTPPPLAHNAESSLNVQNFQQSKDTLLKLPNTHYLTIPLEEYSSTPFTSSQKPAKPISNYQHQFQIVSPSPQPAIHTASPTPTPSNSAPDVVPGSAQDSARDSARDSAPSSASVLASVKVPDTTPAYTTSPILTPKPTKIVKFNYNTSTNQTQRSQKSYNHTIKLPSDTYQKLNSTILSNTPSPVKSKTLSSKNLALESTRASNFQGEQSPTATLPSTFTSPLINTTTADTATTTADAPFFATSSTDTTTKSPTKVWNDNNKVDLESRESSDANVSAVLGAQLIGEQDQKTIKSLEGQTQSEFRNTSNTQLGFESDAQPKLENNTDSESTRQLLLSTLVSPSPTVVNPDINDVNNKNNKNDNDGGDDVAAGPNTSTADNSPVVTINAPVPQRPVPTVQASTADSNYLSSSSSRASLSASTSPTSTPLPVPSSMHTSRHSLEPNFQQTPQQTPKPTSEHTLESTSESSPQLRPKSSTPSCENALDEMFKYSGFIKEAVGARKGNSNKSGSERSSRNSGRIGCNKDCQPLVGGTTPRYDITARGNVGRDQDRLLSLMQIDVDWLKDTITVANRLSFLKDVYKTIQSVKRQKTKEK